MNPTVCAVCRHRPVPSNRSVCETCYPAGPANRVVPLVDALRDIWRRLPDGDPLREVAFAAVEPFGGVPPVEAATCSA
jgi:hypothetical protein